MGLWQEIKNVAKGIAEWGPGQGSGISSRLGLSAGSYADSVSDAVNRTMKSNLDNYTTAAMETVKGTAKDLSQDSLNNIEKGIRSVGKRAIEGREVDGKVLGKILSKNGVTPTDDLLNTINDSFDKNEVFDKYAEYLKSGKTLDAAKDFFGIEAGKDFSMWQKAKMMYGDSTYGGARLKATAGAVGGVSVGTRLLSGGSLTTNARGERDIVGVPFI